ncbi:MAG TPA: methylenetetrahydrofolate--tRNA-(uracil(54)-C(5))-methyltransferase (FADH(2)-oxidizing) TrmFO [Candidatus Margulisiibacteriota bacterium]|nr:methylenetetrahydrofolate--tRNA-(uracil(54)-C(5))-methyltransferase (FADH(2)-oxidizing) TrmFO [Candidatus Margulisiibacteriota bacterium]
MDAEIRNSPVTVIGGGLAGAEAAWQLARRGIAVRLYEMRPVRSTPAHHTDQLAELVCSNSFRSAALDTAVGLLKEEMRQLGSLVMQVADRTRVPAGSALAVDRDLFAAQLTAAILALPEVTVVREELTALPAGPTIVATGPLTSPALSQCLQTTVGHGYLYFYDAIAPIVTAESIDRRVAFSASRYGKGGEDYLNCPMTGDEYHCFVDAVVRAQTVPTKDFERCIYFEGCMPIEEMARRGPATLAFGPMRPVGLRDPRTGQQPHAVVQLRQDNHEATLYNMVGFQTKMTYPEQRRVLRMIPGLEHAEFVRLGSLHRNTFINSPRVLLPTLQLRMRPDTFVAGQLIGVEGYVESAAAGLLAAINVAHLLHGQPCIVPPATTALGALVHYVSDPRRRDFQPMNANYGLFPPLTAQAHGRDKRRVLAARAARDLQAWIVAHALERVAMHPAGLAHGALAGSAS